MYDPDDRSSKRHSAGAQIIAPDGEYVYKETRDVGKSFQAEGHELALRLDFLDDDHSEIKPKIDEKRRRADFYRVSERGTKHAGYLSTNESNRNDMESDDSPWKNSAVLKYIEWDIDVTPLKTVRVRERRRRGEREGKRWRCFARGMVDVVTATRTALSDFVCARDSYWVRGVRW